MNYIRLLALSLVLAISLAGFAACSDDEADAIESADSTEESSEEVRLYVIDLPNIADYVEVGKYKGVEIELATLNDEILESNRKKLLEEVMEMVAADRPAENGDTVVIDYEGFYKDSGEKFENGTATDQSLVLGSKTYIEGFEDGIVGHSAGENFDIFATFPDDYYAPEMQGAEVRFSIKLKEVKEASYPEITDEVAEKLDYENAEALNAAIKKSAEEEVQATNLDAAWKAAVKACTLKEYPKELYDQSVNDFVTYYMDYYKNAAAYYGVEIEELLEMTEEELFADLTEKGKQNADGYLKEELIMFAIAKDMKADVISDEEYDEKVQEYASKQGVTVDKLLESYTEEQVLTNIMWDKVMRCVLDHAVEIPVEVASAEVSSAEDSSTESSEQ